MLVIDELTRRINEKSNPTVMGLDPLIQFIPDHIKNEALSQYGNTIKAATSCLFKFNKEILDKAHPYIAAVKLQMACYEIYGSEGIETFHQTIELASQYDLTIIDDAKRNDIGSTATLYAKGHIGRIPLIEGEIPPGNTDFVTINPYLGSDSILPFYDICKTENKGIFILVRTSNQSASEYQEAKIDNVFLFEKVALDVQQLAEKHLGKNGLSSIGAVVGATWPEEVRKLRKLMPNVLFLVPGYGAQGGTAEHISNCFNSDGYGALINSSRGIIFAYKQPQYQDRFPDPVQFADAAIAAILDMKKDLLTALLKAGKLPEKWSLT